MKTIQPGTIVVATDGSHDADRAVAWAAEQAFLERRPLAVVTVARDTLPMLAAAGAATIALSVDDQLEVARGVVGAGVEIAQHHRPGLSVQGVELLGEPRRVLAELSQQAHLLVIGSRGRGAVRTKLLGSVSASVAKHSTCPVLVCRPRHEGLVRRGIVVGADGTPDSLPVITRAFEQASLRELPLTVVHSAWDPVTSIDGPRVARPGERGFAEAELLLAESVAGFREQYPEVHVQVRVAHGFPHDGLAAESDDHELVVVGRHPADSLTRRFTGAVATAVLERSRTHVLVVPVGGRS